MSTISLPPRRVKPGPKPGRNRLSTRLASILAKIGKGAPGRMVKVNLESLAATLECRPDTLRKLTMRLRERAWFFQGYHTVLLLTHETSEECPRGAWFIWVANRHSLHRIWATPGIRRQLRWHLRRGKAKDWKGYTRRIKKWALAMIFRQRNRRDGKHKGFSHGIRAHAGGARAPNNRAAFRRFGKMAHRISEAYAGTPKAIRIELHGWAVRRLAEWHDREAIMRALAHATHVIRKRWQIRLSNPAAWLSHVASYQLASDGLVPSQRRQELLKKAGR